MSTTFRPMLAAEYDPDKYPIKFPVLASPKIDGIRCVIRHGQPLTRSLKPIPNRHIRAALSGLPDFDGELIVGDPVDPKAWNTTSSAVMSHDGEPEFTYFVFDYAGSEKKNTPYDDRFSWLKQQYTPDNVIVLGQAYITGITDLDFYESEKVRLGYEGIMIRSLDGPYKFGRSTAKEGYLLKMKRFDDLEAEIIGAFERLHHVGEAKVNALGLTERDHKKENYVGAGVLGGFICRVNLGGLSVEFEVGSGFTAEQRAEYWGSDHGASTLIRVAKIKHQGWTIENKPRFPIFLGFRDERDMG